MKPRLAALGWLLLALAGGLVAAEPANLDLAKRELRTYVSSGRYAREIAAVAAQAEAWIGRRAAQPAGAPRLAIVVDLDETLLSNWPELDADDFGGSEAAWDAWMAKAADPAIEPVRHLYRTARRLGVAVIFLTARRARTRASTEKNLRAIGCADYTALIFLPDDSKETVAAYKTAERKRLTAEGRVIVANIGDQESDLAGGYAERTFKLPDPFYLVP